MSRPGLTYVLLKLIVESTILAAVIAHPEPMTIYDDFIYTTNHTCYTAEYDIVRVHASYRDDTLDIYFVQANVTNNIPDYKGLFKAQMNCENANCRTSTVRKLLDNGTCVTSEEQTMYFGTTDGIYKYTNDILERFGSITANIKVIQKAKGRDLIYIVTEDNKLCLVTENGNNMVEHDTIKTVQEIALDSGNNLYFYEKYEDPERYLMFYERYLKPKVLVGDRVLPISGLSDTYTHIRMGNLMGDTIILLGNYFYKLSPNGTSTNLRVGFIKVPTAFSLDLGLIQLYSSGTTLYCFSPLEKLGEALAEGIGKALKALVVVVGKAFEALNPDNLNNHVKL